MNIAPGRLGPVQDPVIDVSGNFVIEVVLVSADPRCVIGPLLLLFFSQVQGATLVYGTALHTA